jgi:hypothetical protein
MSHNDNLDVVKADDNAVTALIYALRAMAGNNAAMTALLVRAGQALPARRAARDTETITFTVPAMSLTDWCNELQTGHSLFFTLFANRYSATSMYHFAIATPLLF